MCANFQLHCAAMEYQVFMWYIPYAGVFMYSLWYTYTTLQILGVLGTQCGTAYIT